MASAPSKGPRSDDTLPEPTSGNPVNLSRESMLRVMKTRMDLGRIRNEEADDTARFFAFVLAKGSGAFGAAARRERNERYACRREDNIRDDRKPDGGKDKKPGRANVAERRAGHYRRFKYAERDQYTKHVSHPALIISEV